MREYRLLTVLVTATLVACGGGPAVQLMPDAAYQPVPAEAVRVYPALSDAAISPAPVRVATARVRTATPSEAEYTRLVTALRRKAAPRGANALMRTSGRDGFWLVAVFLTDSQRILADSLTVLSSSTARGHVPIYVSPGASGGGTVQVKGYRRKDGTYVRPHTRSRPKPRR
jgi:hypothetical protein